MTTTIAIESTNLPGLFVRHADFLGELSGVGNDLDRRDATFELAEGLADSALVSLRSQNLPGHVLRHEGFRIKLNDHTGGNDSQQIREDATFVLTPGLDDPTAVSFRSLNFPDRFLRHRDFHLFVEPADSDLARRDATFRIVPGFLPQFTFDGTISAQNRDRLVDRHRAAVASIAGCSRISGDEKLRLLRKYQTSISHGTTTAAGVNASAHVGGSHIDVNFGVLFPQGNDEIAQTLIHEMTHCAGFTHPERRDPPAGSSCSDPPPRAFDCPNDGGQYYGTPPLRAEFCIAGAQSDLEARLTEKTSAERCVIDADGLATVHTL
ncbi:AbfB domain-containing protein [Streptomyces sp. NPDC053493]|uniref:AbfB domain-containing protein n=1 Tax=Streptomyces sp. NPDC053493 TaxID=3365705 RepID=UPI0037CEE865